MSKWKCDISQQYFKWDDSHFVKCESFSLTWSCGSRQRDTTSSEWKFQLNNLAVKVLNVLVFFFCFIWIPMLWVYGHYIYFNCHSAGIDFSRQTSTDVRFCHLSLGIYHCKILTVNHYLCLIQHNLSTFLWLELFWHQLCSHWLSVLFA